MASSDEAIEAIYAAGVDRPGWEQAIQLVGATFNSATCAFYVESHRQAPTILHRGIMFGYNAADLVAYSDYFGALNPFNRPDLRRDDIGVLSDTVFDERFGRDNRFADSEYHVDWARPQSVHHVVAQRLRSSGDAVLCAAFWRPAEVGPHSTSEIKQFGRLMRHINRAVDIGGRLRTAEAQFEASIERTNAAVFALDHQGRLNHCNSLADELLSNGSAILRRDGHLESTNSEDQAALDRLIGCALDARTAAWAENASITLRRTDAGPPLVLRVTAVQHRFEPFMPKRTAAVVVTVEGFEAASERNAKYLRRRYQLTAAQARLALSLRSGKPLKQVALDLGITFETARSHLKAVFVRTGTHRQTELVLMLQDLDQQ